MTKWNKKYKRATEDAVGTAILGVDITKRLHEETIWYAGDVVTLTRKIETPVGVRYRIKGTIHWVGEEDLKDFKTI